MKKGFFIKLIVILLMITGLLSQAGSFLVVNQSPKKSDAIVVLAGDKGKRMEFAAKLFEDGYANKMVISGGPIYNNVTAADLMKKHAVQLKVPEKNILLENKADSTFQNAKFTKEILEKNKLHSAIIVTSNYHMRRTKMVFDKMFGGSSITLTYCAAKDPDFTPIFWWTGNKSIMYVFTEYVKLVGYGLGRES